MAAKLAEGEGFRGAELVDFKGSLQLLNSSHLEERDNMLLRGILCPSWPGQEGICSVWILWQKDGDGHLFWECSFLPILHVRELPEFVSILPLDRGKWPRCLLWHGWLPGLSSAADRNPWAASFGQLACCELERCLGAYPVDALTFGPRPIAGTLMILLWR